MSNNQERRYTDQGEGQNLPKDVVGAVERKLREGDSFSPRNTDTPEFVSAVESASKTFQLRTQEATETAGADPVRTDKPSEAKKRELSPEQSKATLQTLRVRFQNNPHLHKGVKFEDVKKSLEANPEALWSIAQMEAKGHKPDVYNTDDKGFDVGTCSKESPESARNCVYDKEAADWFRKNRPNETFNGSAVEMAQEMGIDLMDPTLYKEVLQKKGKFDLQTWSWLLTHSNIRSTGAALVGRRAVEYVYVNQVTANFHGARRAFRGSLRVSWKA